MAVAETIVFSILPNTFYSLAIDFVVGKCSFKSPSHLMKRQLTMIKVYANSLLAVLNSRAALGSNPRNVSDSTELSTSFHVAPHQDNSYLGQVSILSSIYHVILRGQDRSEHVKVLAEHLNTGLNKETRYYN